jgi:hypothetical protein
VCSGFPLSYGVFVTMPSDEQEVVLRRVVQGFIDRIGPAFQHKAAVCSPLRGAVSQCCL